MKKGRMEAFSDGVIAIIITIMVLELHIPHGAVLWGNLNLLFWLSLIPFVTDWMGENHFSKWPVALYGGVLIMNGISYSILANLLIRCEGPDCALAEAMDKGLKGKMSVVLYAIGIFLSFVNPRIALGIYVAAAVMWFIPDQRIEKLVNTEK
jgi:uncharacterized membrane protein